MMEFIEGLKDYVLWSNTAYAYAKALLIFLLALIILKIFQVFILAKLRKLAKKTQTDFDDMLIALFSGIRPPFYLLISFYFSLKSLFLSDLLNDIIMVLFLLVSVLCNLF